MTMFLRYMKRWTRLVTAGSIILAAMSCARPRDREQSGTGFVTLPPGLDSASRETWIAQQRSACRGRFAVLVDLQVFAAQCTRDTASVQHPPNER
jgi:hypothetical protein